MTTMSHTINSISSCSCAYSTARITLPFVPVELRQDDRPESAPDARVTMCTRNKRSTALRTASVIEIIREEMGR